MNKNQDIKKNKDLKKDQDFQKDFESLMNKWIKLGLQIVELSANTNVLLQISTLI